MRLAEGLQAAHTIVIPNELRSEGSRDGEARRA
jgi:hypothetical protein